DVAIVGAGTAELESDLNYHASSVYLRTLARLLPELNAGGQIAFAQRSTYIIGPTWTDVSLALHAADLFNGIFFAELRPLKELRFNYDLQTQRTEIERGIPNLVDPRFTDNQLRAAYRFFDIGWVRGLFRW